MSTVPTSLTRYRSDLVAAIDRELGEARRAWQRTRPRQWHPRWGALLLATATVAVASLVVTVATPWHSSPGILDRAQAALPAPSAGQILYEKVTVRPIVFSSLGTVGHVRLWVDGARPRRFRMTFGGAWQVELGGTLGASKGLTYAASDRALHSATFPFRVRQSDLDPAAFIRPALESGRATLDGRATIRGRDVIRIQLRAWFDSFSPPARIQLLLDADAANPALDYYPGVLAEDSSIGFPIDPGSFLPGSPGYSSPTLLVLPGRGSEASFPKLHRMYDFEEYRLLVPTAANRRMANVRAMHPHANVA
jgi:hypothetical protein